MVTSSFRKEGCSDSSLATDFRIFETSSCSALALLSAGLSEDPNNPRGNTTHPIITEVRQFFSIRFTSHIFEHVPCRKSLLPRWFEFRWTISTPSGSLYRDVG